MASNSIRNSVSRTEPARHDIELAQQQGAGYVLRCVCGWQVADGSEENAIKAFGAHLREEQPAGGAGGHLPDRGVSGQEDHGVGRVGGGGPTS